MNVDLKSSSIQIVQIVPLYSFAGKVVPNIYIDHKECVAVNTWPLCSCIISYQYLTSSGLPGDLARPEGSCRLAQSCE